MGKALLLLSLLLALPLLSHGAARADAVSTALPQDKAAAVILSYQRVGEDDYPLSSIDTDQFSAQIDEIKGAGYNVLPLPAIIQALKAGVPLPPRTLALTFDGGYRSALENALPLLIKNNLPFTIFIATDEIDRNDGDTMSWDDLRRLHHSALATIALLPASGARLDGATPGEIKRQINDGRARLRAELGIEAAYFAYPLGQYSSTYRAAIAAGGFDAAFGQQDGVAYVDADLYALPRFAMAESNSDIDRFRLIVNALPLPITDVTPRDPLLKSARPDIGFTVDASLAPLLPSLTCFVEGQGKPDVQILGKARVELRLQADLTEERSIVNCTLPGPAPVAGEDQRWRWFGLLLSAPASAVDIDTTSVAAKDMETTD